MAYIQDYIKNRTYTVTPTGSAVGLPQSGSTYDSRVWGVDFGLQLYTPEKSVDGNNSSYLRFDNDGSGASGFIVDLRNPSIHEHEWVPTTESLENRAFFGSNVGLFCSPAAFTVTDEHKFNQDIDNSAALTPSTSTGTFAGFIADFGKGGIILDRIEIAFGDDSYTQGLTFSITPTTIYGDTLSSQILNPTVGVDAIDTVHFRNGIAANKFDSSRGFVQKRDIPPIQKLTITALVSSTNSLKFSVFKVYKAKYDNPAGVNLKYINAQLWGGNNSKTFNWDAEISSNGTNYTSAGTITTSGSAPNKTTKYLISSSEPVTHLRLTQDGSTDGNQYDQRIYEISYAYQDLPLIETDFDFNDSVLETKAWNSSRYDGKQLLAQKLNKISRNDIGNNNKTPIIRNYTRNIYLGNEIVGMNENGGDDETLTQFPDFSYAQINSYITINEDGTITRNTLDPEENNDAQKKAFYRPFLYDFQESSFCNFILGDPTVKNNLKSKYAVYFNGGQLKKLITLQTAIDDGSQVVSGVSLVDPRYNGGYITISAADTTDGNIDHVLKSDLPPTGSLVGQGPLFPNYNYNIPAQVGPGSAFYMGYYTETLVDIDNYDEDDINIYRANNTFISASGFTSSLHNIESYSTFYTGSLTRVAYVANNQNSLVGPVLDVGELVNFTNNFLSYKANSNYKGDKRLFITATKYHSPLYFKEVNGKVGNPKPLYTFEPNNIHTASLGTDLLNLSSLTTFEVQDFNTFNSPTNGQYFKMLEYKFNPSTSVSLIDCHTIQNGETTTGLREKDYVPNFDTGSFMFSVVDDDVPSLLVRLNKEKELFDGKGEKPFVAIPENLHPYIKDNLIFYLSKAGIDIGGNATDQVEEDLSKKPKISELSPRERRLLALERLQQNLERRRAIETARRDRRRAITRREDREERRKRRVENRQERRKNRKDRKENRQENRQERRRNRRNRRRRR